MGSSARAAAVTKVSFDGWAFEPQVTEADIKLFMQQNPDIAVDYTPLDLQTYNQKMIALFVANTPPDAFFIRDTDLGAWVEAGWVQPIDGMPGLDDLNAEMFPYIRQAMSYKGKQYGTPYYGDIFMYMYDRKAVANSHVTQPIVTLEQLKNAALEVKKAGLAEYPILKGYKTDVDGLSEFWSMVLASGGHLFDQALDPVYPTQDKTALAVLEWLMDAMHTWKIMDPSGLQMDQTQARDVFLGGQGIFTSNVGNVLPRANNKQYSKRAGDIQIMRFPALQDVGKGPMGWRSHVPASAQRPNKDPPLGVWSGSWVARTNPALTTLPGLVSALWRWLLLQAARQRSRHHCGAEGRGYDLAIRSEEYATAQMRENISSPWYSEWDRFTQEQIQNVLLGQTKPIEALQASAAKASALKKQS